MKVFFDRIKSYLDKTSFPEYTVFSFYAIIIGAAAGGPSPGAGGAGPNFPGVHQVIALCGAAEGITQEKECKEE